MTSTVAAAIVLALLGWLSVRWAVASAKAAYARGADDVLEEVQRQQAQPKKHRTMFR